MKSVQDVQRLIADRIDRHWADSVLAHVRGDVDPRWPWTVTLTNLNGATLNERWSEVWRWILDWQSWAQANRCELIASNRRVGGAIRSIPTRVAVPDIYTATAAAGGEWSGRLEAAGRRAQALQRDFPDTLTSGLLRATIRLSDVDFDLARTAAAWFRQNSAAGLTARQVPIAGLHAKWLDQHLRIVTGLSGRTELGLVSRPSRVHFSYLDGGWIGRGNRRRDSVALDEPYQPPGYQPQVLVITENKDTALFFPETEGGIVIEGNGSAASRLASIPWIMSCPRIFYWGDLDAHGLIILDRLRGSGIEAESIAMNLATLDRYSRFASPTLSDGRPLPTGAPAPTPFLTNGERALLECLTDPEWTGARRIEQERIPLGEAHAELMRAIADRTS